jgi:trehalose synthase
VEEKAVLGGAVGGIKTQIIDGVTGYLVHSPEGAPPPCNCWMTLACAGAWGKMVKQNFLLTRHAKDYMLVMLALEHPGKDVVPLK